MSVYGLELSIRFPLRCRELAYLMPRITIAGKSEIAFKQKALVAYFHPGLEDVFTQELWEFMMIFLDKGEKG